MQFSITIPFVFTLAIFASATPPLALSQRQDEGMQDLADLTNQVNEAIVSTTQFLEAFPALNESSLSAQASTITRTIENAADYLNDIANELSDNAMVQVVQGKLLDSGFLNAFALEIGNIAEGLPSLPFGEILGLYCSDVIPRINTLFQIVGGFLDNGATIVALLPNNCGR